jgi:hypothetical protein
MEILQTAYTHADKTFCGDTWMINIGSYPKIPATNQTNQLEVKKDSETASQHSSRHLSILLVLLLVLMRRINRNKRVASGSG